MGNRTASRSAGSRTSNSGSNDRRDPAVGNRAVADDVKPAIGADHPVTEPAKQRINITLGEGEQPAASGGSRKRSGSIPRDKADALKEKPVNEAADVKKAASRSKKLSDNEAREVANGVVMGFNIAATLMTEIPEAAMTELEAAQVHDPLERIIKRMSPNAAKRFQTLTDPLAVAIAMSYWAARVIPLVQEKNRKKADVHRNNQFNPDAFKPASSGFSSNGKDAHQSETSSVPSDPT